MRKLPFDPSLPQLDCTKDNYVSSILLKERKKNTNKIGYSFAFTQLFRSLFTIHYKVFYEMLNYFKLPLRGRWIKCGLLKESLKNYF